MEIVCRDSLRARAFVWQPRQGTFALGVVCKVTFALAPGESPVCGEQAEVVGADVHHQGNPQRSLALASELVPVKKDAELLLAGHAHAPGGQAVPWIVARVGFGDVEKAVAVFGDSYIALNNSFSDPVPWTKMPLSWERAAAEDTRNPVGIRMGKGALADAWGRVLLPNLRPADARLASRWDVFAPAGFGPLSPDWPVRRARLQRHAHSVHPSHVLEQPLPEGEGAAFFQAAPEDQILGEIAGDEHLVLENLLAGTPRLETRLARVVPLAHAELPGAGHPMIELRCDTLVIDTDRATASLVWRGHVAIDSPARAAAPGARVVVSSKVLTSRLDLSPRGSSPTPRVKAAPATVKETVALSGGLPGFVLPFGAKTGVVEEEPVAAATTTTTLGFGAAPAGPVLPFGTGESTRAAAATPEAAPFARSATEEAPVGEEAESPEGEEPEVVFPEAHRRTVALASWMRPDPSGSPLPFARTPHAGPGGTERPPPEPSEGGHTAPALLAPIALLQAFAQAPETPPERGPEFAPPPTPESAPPAPPPMLGPLAALARPDDDGAPAPAEVESPPPKPFLLEDWPIERCARLDAKVALAPGAESAALEEEDVAAEHWGEASERWRAEIKAETARGKKRLLTAYDTAYVAELEALRGPITPVEYAGLVVAAEQGGQDDAIDALGLPRDVMPRIRRVWLRRLLSDAALAREVRGAMRALATE